MKLNDFRLSYETSFLFTLSYEYNIPLAKLLSMFNISDKVFWAYLALLAPMSKMGVRKGGQLSKIANRVYKQILGIKEKTKRKIDFEVVDENGEFVLDEKGKVVTEKKTIIEHNWIELKENEQAIRKVLGYFITRGYSNGERFISDNKVMDLKTTLALKGDENITIDGDVYSRSTLIEYTMEKYFSSMTVKEFRELSVKGLYTLLTDFGVFDLIEEELETPAIAERRQ